MKKNFKFFALTALFAGLSMSAFAQEKATTVWRYTVSGNDATLIGFVADLGDAGKADVTIPNQVTDPANASKKYNVTAINEDAFSISNDKGKLKKLTIAASNLKAIPAKLLQDCGNLTEIDLSGATSLGKDGADGIPAGAFKGTKIASVDLSKTKVQVIHNWFNTGYSYLASGGNLTAAQAEKLNAPAYAAAGVTPVKAGDVKTTGSEATFSSLVEINDYYKELNENAKVAGDMIPYTKETANAANKADFPGCVDETDQKDFTVETALAYNVAKIDGAMPAGYVLDNITAPMYNTATSGSKAAGAELTAEEAEAYNETLPGAVKAGPGNPEIDLDGNPVYYTTDEAYDYNSSLVAACHKENEESTTPFSHAQAYAYNNENVIPAEKQVAIGDVDPRTESYYADDDEALAANITALLTVDPTLVLGDDYFDTTCPADDKVIPASAKNTTLTSVTLNSAWTAIDDSAFERCEGLTSINFGTAANDVTSQVIGNKAFLGTKLAELNFVGTVVTWMPGDVFVYTQNPLVIDPTYKKVADKAPTANTTLKAVKFNKVWSSVDDYTFQNCTALATVTFEDRDILVESAPGTPVQYADSFWGIGEYAFARTAIAEIEIPAALDATMAGPSAIEGNAFAGCTNLKSFTYMVDNETTWAAIDFVVDELAFAGCKGLVYWTTNANIGAYNFTDPVTPAPKNSTMKVKVGDGFVTAFDKKTYWGKPGKYYIKYYAVSPIKVKKSEAKVYNAYLGGTGYDATLNMALYKAVGGYYEIGAGDVVLIITENKDLQFEAGTYGGTWLNGSSSMIDPDPYELGLGDNALNIVTEKEGITRAELDYLAGAERVIYGWVSSEKKQVTGWQKITTGEIFPQGSMFIFAVDEEAAGRLTVNWLDEDGNIEEQTTGINSIFGEKVVEDGEIYNLQGIRVNKAQKGMFIKNGKKYVVK